MASLALVLVAGCTGVSQAPGVGADDPGLREATALANRGQHAAAADAYMRLAADASGPLRERYQLRAVRERQLAGDLDGAQVLLDTLPDPISQENLVGWAQVAGDLAIARNEPRRALAAIGRAPRSRQPRAAAEIERIRGEALFRTGDIVGGTEALLEREVWLDESQSIAANQRLLWTLFQRFGAPDNATIDAIDDPVLSAWLSLGQLAAGGMTGTSGMALALRNWQQQHPQHPANNSLLPELLSGQDGAVYLPDRLALLLPLSGRQQLAGSAIRDGFMAAYYNRTDAGQRPEIRVYDVEPDGPAAAYQRAINEGAQLVVGPLLKSNVLALASSPGGLSVPTLSLNYLPDDQVAPPGLVQFALAPEDEAAEAANRALAEGRRRAIALVPNNEWGRRLLQSFAKNYEEQGGVLVDHRLYEASGKDFSYGIQDILLISESRDRETRLSANLGMDLSFEPRRRDDVDLIFLAAQAQAGKLLRPQLRFYYAGGIPTYATSAIYQQGSRGNSDLNGIQFPDMPWVVAPTAEMAATRASLQEYWPGEASRRARLFAMGYDAFGLASKLTGPEGMLEVDGVTGRLYRGRDNRIHRRLAWAKIRRGEALAVPPIDKPPVATPEN
ncbi:MAG: penicillin-binding protein activator [Gammaproteobacteria bacterium]